MSTRLTAHTAVVQYPLTGRPRPSCIRYFTAGRQAVRCSAEDPSLQQGTVKHKRLVDLSARYLKFTLLSNLGSCQAALADSASAVQPYVPSPVHVGWEIWVGAAAGVIPFIIGAYQFTARILIQQRCETCGGNGLVQRGKFQRKCPECGGFFPWQGWKQFLTSTAAPGNGGVLRQPRKQEGVIYRVPAKKPDIKAQDETR